MKKFKHFLTISFFLLLVACSPQPNITTKESSSTAQTSSQVATNYETLVKNFKKITADQLKEYNNTFVYLGRSTCQYCQQFVPVLHNIQQKLNIEVLYIDTTDFKNDTALQNLVKQYSLNGVPSFLYIQNQNGELFDQDNSELENWIKEKL